MRIRILNVKYSPNIGDGFLNECIETYLKSIDPGLDIESIDLAARQYYGDGGDRNNKIKLLSRLPMAIRRLAVRVVLPVYGQVFWRPHYAKFLAEADVVLVGGGNLLADIDLNFPSKLDWALAEVRRRKIPVIVYGVGASLPWSRRGAALFERAFGLATPVAVFVRDEPSKAVWDSMLLQASGRRANVVRDPGLLAAAVWSPTPRSTARPTAALGIMSHTALAYHTTTTLSEGALAEWFLAAAAALIQLGYDLTLFSNGSPEDTRYLMRLKPQLMALSAPVTITILKKPSDLAALASSADVLIAHRMHAVIAAYAYGTPAISLAWDGKVAAFAKSVGREQWHMDPAVASADAVVEAADRTRRAGVAVAEHARAIAETGQGVRRLYAVLKDLGARGPPGPPTPGTAI